MFLFQVVSSPPTDENGFEDFLSCMVPANYPKLPEEDLTAGNPQSMCNMPRSLVATDYHVLLLLKSSVKVVNVLNEGLEFDDNYSEVHLLIFMQFFSKNNFRPYWFIQLTYWSCKVQGRPLNIIKDAVRGTVWCYTERGVFRYSINEEDRNVWKIFLDKGDFVKAMEFSKHDSDKLEAIHLKQAEHCFVNKE